MKKLYRLLIAVYKKDNLLNLLSYDKISKKDLLFSCREIRSPY